MKDLENRIGDMVKCYFPDTPEEVQTLTAAFLTAECWNMINEQVTEAARYMRKQYERALGQQTRYKKKTDRGGTSGS